MALKGLMLYQVLKVQAFKGSKKRGRKRKSLQIVAESIEHNDQEEFVTQSALAGPKKRGRKTLNSDAVVETVDAVVNTKINCESDLESTVLQKIHRKFNFKLKSVLQMRLEVVFVQK